MAIDADRVQLKVPVRATDDGIVVIDDLNVMRGIRRKGRVEGIGRRRRAHIGRADIVAVDDDTHMGADATRQG